jgi:hypothetical protein
MTFGEQQLFSNAAKAEWLVAVMISFTPNIPARAIERFTLEQRQF